MTQCLIAIKYAANNTVLHYTNTVILLIIVIIIKWDYSPQKNSNYQVGKSLKLWVEKTTASRDSNIFKLRRVITIQEECQNFEIVGFSSHAGWAPRFLVVSHTFLKGSNFYTLNQAFFKQHSGKPSSKTFPVGTTNKYNCSGHPSNVKDIE